MSIIIDVTPRRRGQRGRSKATLDLIATCSEIIEQVRPISVRGTCYRLFVAGHIGSMEVRNTQKISRLLTEAREESFIPWEWIVDESRQIEREPHWTNLNAYADVIKRSYRRDFWAHQTVRVIVISEKSTVAGILRPVLSEYGVPFLSAHGFSGATTVHDLAETEALDARWYVFVYVGDHDPSGMYMSEVDLPSRLKKYGATDQFDIERVALTTDDIVDLPCFAAKKTDPRFKWYVQRYGQDACEIDAMNPNDLRDRVEQAIVQYIDAEAWERHKFAEVAEQETVRKIAKRMTAAVA